MSQLRNMKTYSRPTKSKEHKKPVKRESNFNWGHVLTIAGAIIVLSGLITGSLFLFGNIPTGPAKTPKAHAATPTPPTILADFAIAPTTKTDPAKLNFTTSIYNGDTKVTSFARPAPIDLCKEAPIQRWKGSQPSAGTTTATCPVTVQQIYRNRCSHRYGRKPQEASSRMRARAGSGTAAAGPGSLSS